MKKYFIIALAAFVLEVASTMYIKSVSDRSVVMVFWALAGPFLALPFVGYMVETNNWKDRIKMATSQAIGYALGAIVVYLIN